MTIKKSVPKQAVKKTVTKPTAAVKKIAAKKAVHKNAETTKPTVKKANKENSSVVNKVVKPQPTKKTVSKVINNGDNSKHMSSIIDLTYKQDDLGLTPIVNALESVQADIVQPEKIINALKVNTPLPNSFYIQPLELSAKYLDNCFKAQQFVQQSSSVIPKLFMAVWSYNIGLLNSYSKTNSKN
jgi:hypothetical protein